MHMPKRPKGITILSIVMILSGLSMLVVVALFGRSAGDTVVDFVDPAVLLTFSILVGGCSLAAGIGMWTGKKWGYWLTVIFLAYTIVAALSGFLKVDALAAQFSATDAQIMTQKVKFVGRIITTGLVLSYLFFRNSVKEYFQSRVITPN